MEDLPRSLLHAKNTYTHKFGFVSVKGRNAKECLASLSKKCSEAHCNSRDEVEVRWMAMHGAYVVKVAMRHVEGVMGCSTVLPCKPTMFGDVEYISTKLMLPLFMDYAFAS